jgi:ribosomal protein S18 acetylase RimI-like enzyme
VESEFVRRTQIGADRARNFAIRQPCIADREAIREFFAALSPRASYLRFFVGAPPASQTMLRLLAGGSASTDVLVATDGDVVIGHAMAADRAGPGERLTEIGVVVADAYRGLGMGSALVRRLLGQAQLRGVTAVAMEVLAENRQVLTMITDHWPTAYQERAGTCITIHAPLPPGLHPEEPAPWSPARRPGPAGTGQEPWPQATGNEPWAAEARDEPWPPGTGKEAVAAASGGGTAR